MNIAPSLQNKKLFGFGRIDATGHCIAGRCRILYIENWQIVEWEVFLANAWRFQQLIDICDIFAAHGLTGRDPERILWAIPIGFNEHRSIQLWYGIPQNCTELWKLGRLERNQFDRF